MPVVRTRALDPAEIRARVREEGLLPADGDDVLACWPLAEERGSSVADRSGHARDGTIVNRGTWMVGGPSFDADVPRFGDYDPRRDARRGHGLRLASDDLYDCRWEATHELRVPEDARPGLHYARFEFEIGAEKHLQHVTFIVRRGESKEPAPILVLAATNTWIAYSGTPFARSRAERRQVWGTGGAANSAGDPPAFCLYRGHRAGQGTYQVGMRMPWPAASPYVRYGGRTDYSHLTRADLFTHAWLERAGYDFDVITDLDLHRDPGILGRYRAFVVNGHSEYWSLPMYEGLRRYLGGGGRVLCLSGNSLFWRVSYDGEETVLECRKVDCPGNQMPPERRGECWHSSDGRRGGLLRECGYPAADLVGLESIGWIDHDNPEHYGPYHALEAGHFLFAGTGLAQGDSFGEAADGRPSNAGGHEVDVTLETVRRIQDQPTPPGARLPEPPEGIAILAAGRNWGRGVTLLDYFIRPASKAEPVGAEIIWWERPAGGLVFAAGAVSAGWSLYHDPRFARVVANALERFGVRPREG